MHTCNKINIKNISIPSKNADQITYSFDRSGHNSLSSQEARVLWHCWSPLPEKIERLPDHM